MSNRELQSILDNSTAVIQVKDLAGRYVRINRRFEKIFGLDRSQILGKTDHDLFPKEIADRFRANDVEVAETGHPLEFEETALHKDGPHEYISIKFPLFDVSGVVYATAGIFTDITDRKRAERKLRDSEQLFRSIFENAQIGIGVFNIDRQELSPNRALQEMLGYSERELSRLETWDEITLPEESASDAKRYAEIVQGKREKDEWEQRFVRRDGRIVVTSVRFSLLRDAVGKPQYVASLQEDITERKAAEDLIRKRDEELRRANFLADTALELSKAGYWHVPLDGSGWYNSSPRRVAVFGEIPQPEYRYRLDEMFGHATEGDEKAAKIAREAFNAAVEGKADRYDTVFAYKRPIDGRIAWIHALGHVQKDTDGKPTDMYGVSQDITEFKRLEEELVTAKEVAEAATRAKSDFLANMSHEIRTPMNAILGMTNLTLKTELTLKQRDYLTKTRVAGQALLGIINDILDFSKIEAGKLEMEKTEFYLDDVIENLSSVVSQKAQDKNLEFLIAAPDDLSPTLVGDPLRLGQILINLVNNAVKFTERGEVVVTVGLEEQASDRVKLKFSVRDSGIGMRPEQTARLFQPFSQADTSTTRKYGGTGLGLSICKRLVEMMGGEIWVESNYGEGSTFLFTAWFDLGAGATKRKRFIPDLVGVRALVVDDNEQAREILCDVLRGFSLRADSVSSGVQAIKKIASADSQDPYGLVLMDWQMPGMNGVEASRLIIRGHNLTNVPRIVMVTAFGREEVRAQAEELGIKGYLLKPVSPSLLYDTLMNVFGVAEQEGDRSRPKKKQEDLLSPNASGIRILLVEDNEVNQQVATELLESAGAIVAIADHGGEAVRILTEGKGPSPFDVVLMDLQMPEMDGFTATTLIRADPRLQGLPIIAMTAHALVEERQRCLEAGMNDHVSKPIDPEALFATLLRWARPLQTHPAGIEATPAKTPNDVVLPEIEGIDVSDGLARVAGNQRLYRDLLVRFALDQCDVSAQISAALERGDQKLAERIAHTVKAVAGNLGIRKIFSSAESVEKAIRELDPATPALLREFSSLVDHQVHAIRQTLPETPTQFAREELNRDFDAREASSAARHLRELLEASDGSSKDAFSVFTDAVSGIVDKPWLDALGVAIREFDFDSALSKLNDIIQMSALSESLNE